MFSTSMMESSTTEPSAIASPPSVIVLMVMPHFSRTMTAVSSDMGIATSEMHAVRTLPNNRNSTTATRMPAKCQRVLHVPERGLDERGRPVQAPIDSNARLLEDRFHLVECGFQ